MNEQARLVHALAIFLFGLGALSCPVTAYAELFPTTPEAARFGPEAGRSPQDLRAYGKPAEMMDIIPNRPVAAHDQNGNRVYFTPHGKLMLSVAPDGTQTFSLNTKSVSINTEGKITQTSERDKDDKSKIVTRNGEGEITGTQQLGFGGKVVAAYDMNGKLTQTYSYNKYGKKLDFVLDEMTMTKTVYDKAGKPSVDVNFEGGESARYKYGADGRLAYKEDSSGNKTYYVDGSRMDYTTDLGGAKLLQYFYTADSQGNMVLDHSVSLANDASNGDITYFKHNKPQYTETSFHERSRDYQYDASNEHLVFTFDHYTNETTFYAKDGKTLYTTINEIKVKDWLYASNGRMMGTFDYRNRTLTIYQYQREDIVLRLDEGGAIPTGDEIAQRYDERGPLTASQVRASAMKKD